MAPVTHTAMEWREDGELEAADLASLLQRLLQVDGASAPSGIDQASPTQAS